MSAQTTTHPQRPVPVRRISFDFATDDESRLFMSGDLIMSYVIAVLSSSFPEGEDFFVRSVRNYRDRIDDPALRKAVGGFIGQESIHGREHRVLNDRLSELGYPTAGLDRLIGRSLRLRERISTKKSCLALTAALEHYTATLAWVLLENDDAREMITDDEIRNLLLWHALEESEHKAVAFDVYRAVGGGEALRIVTMAVITFFGIIALSATVLFSALRDPITRRNPLRLLRSIWRLRRSPWLRPEVARMVLSYHRPGFHPDDHDTEDLLALWRAELFGDSGSLSPRLLAPA